MKRKFMKSAVIAAVGTIMGAFNALAGVGFIVDINTMQPAWRTGDWIQEDGRWRWMTDDGTYVLNDWLWIDGNDDGTAEYYYFDEKGYLLTDTVTPDGEYVDGNGSRTIGGTVVSTTAVQRVEGDTSTSMEKLQIGIYVKDGDTGRYVNLQGETGICILTSTGSQIRGKNAAGQNVTGSVNDGKINALVMMQYAARDENGVPVRNCTGIYGELSEEWREGNTLRLNSPTEDVETKKYTMGTIELRVLNDRQIEVISAKLKELGKDAYVDESALLGVYTLTPDYQFYF